MIDVKLTMDWWVCISRSWKKEGISYVWDNVSENIRKNVHVNQCYCSFKNIEKTKDIRAFS